MSKSNKKKIEKEDLYGNEIIPIQDPYNPLDVDIIQQPLALRNIFDRLENNEIILDPDFQRNHDLWSLKQQSRLIESLLIRIPLPAFYFDSSTNEDWTVVDGLQRLTALYNFVIRKPEDEKKLRLEGLEYLSGLNGCSYEELPRTMQRRLQEQNIFAYIIRPGTPNKVKTSIFERINTGGISLNAAEIRNSVYRGQAANAVKEMAESEEFINATRGKVSSKRMLDREFTARFVAFYLLGYESYNGNMEEYISNGMDKLKEATTTTISQMISDFKNSMLLSKVVFGEYAFRKYLKNKNGKWTYGPINRALFECVSVCFALIDSEKRIAIKNQKESFFHGYNKLFEGIFYSSINSATGTEEHVRIRYREFNSYIERF